MNEMLLLPREAPPKRATTNQSDRSKNRCFGVPTGGSTLLSIARDKATEPSAPEAGYRFYIVNIGRPSTVFINSHTLGVAPGETMLWYQQAFANTALSGVWDSTCCFEMDTNVIGCNWMDAINVCVASPPASEALTAEIMPSNESPVAVEISVSTAASQVDFIQDSLSLSVTQIAEILGISRPTIYRWLRDEVEWPRDGRVAARLQNLSRLGKVWRGRSTQPLGRLVEVPVTSANQRLFDLLIAPVWAETAIDEALVKLADRANQRFEQRRETQEHIGAVRAEGQDKGFNPDLGRLRTRALSRRSRYYGR
jgi:predicted DNA-binding transcriptional regulator AlpA